ncbi:MAG: hypothetical protein WBP29_11205 [Candidatus Zixiibacteriota bacterium]
MKRISHWLFAATVLLFASGAQLVAAETTVGAEIHAQWLLHLNNQGLGKNYNYFDVHRGQLIVEHTFNEKYSAKIVVESYTNGFSVTDGWRTRLRLGYFQANKALPYTDVRFGMQNMLWNEKVEGVWGMRYVDPVSLFKLGYQDEADLGVSLIGNCPGGYGILAVQVVNGPGYHESELNKYKDFAIYGEFHPFPKNADWSEVAILGQWYMGYPNISDGSGGESFSKNTMKDRIQGGAIVKYRKWLTAYGEYFVTRDDADWNNNTDDIYVQEANGFTVFGRLYVATTEKWLSRVSIFSKYEYVDKNKNAENPLVQDDGDARFLVAGVSYEPVDNYEFAVVFRRDTVSELAGEGGVRIEEIESNSMMFTMRAYIK